MLPKETKQRLTFSKSEKLKRQKTIESLFTQHKNFKIYPFKLVWITEPLSDDQRLKMGVSVSKRLYKTAVKRNFIKRRMREGLRLNKPILIEGLASKNITLSFMLIYIGSDVVPFTEFQTKIKQLIIRLGDKINN